MVINPRSTLVFPFSCGILIFDRIRTPTEVHLSISAGLINAVSTIKAAKKIYETIIDFITTCGKIQKVLLVI